MNAMEIAALLGAAVAIALFVAGIRLLRRRPRLSPKAEQAQSADERRLAATSDPVRRAKLERRINNRLKG